MSSLFQDLDLIMSLIHFTSQQVVAKGFPT